MIPAQAVEAAGILELVHLEGLMLDERTCDVPVCLSAARLRLFKECGYEVLVCARHRRQFDSWTDVVDSHGHPVDTPAKWSNI